MKLSLLLLVALATTLPAIAKEPTTAPGPKADLLVKTREMWDGTPLPAYPTKPAEINIVKFTIPAKSELPWHKHPSINAGYVTKGHLTVRTEEGKELKLKAGDTLVELVDKWHTGRNEGDEDVEIIVFYASTPGTPLAIRRDEAASPTPTPKPND